MNIQEFKKDEAVRDLMQSYCICLDTANNLLKEILEIHPNYLNDFYESGDKEMIPVDVRQAIHKKGAKERSESMFEYMFDYTPSSMSEIIDKFAELKKLHEQNKEA